MKDAFETLVGRPMSDAERQKLLKVRDALGIRDNDALWSLIIALEYYRSYHERIPAKLGAALDEALVKTKEVADSVIAASSQEALKKLSESVAGVAEKVAAEAAGTKQLYAFAVAVGVSVLALTGVWWQASRWGHDRGYAEAYAMARDEKVAAEWGNSADGRLAKRMADTGLLRRVAECTGEKWVRKPADDGRMACFPTGAGADGWYLP